MIIIELSSAWPPFFLSSFCSALISSMQKWTTWGLSERKITSLDRTEMSKSVKFNSLWFRWDLQFGVPANISPQNTWTLFVPLHQNCPFWAESPWARCSMGREFCSSTESSRMMLISTSYGSGSQRVSVWIHRAWGNAKRGSDFCEKHFGKENQKMMDVPLGQREWSLPQRGPCRAANLPTKCAAALRGEGEVSPGQMQPHQAP